MKQILLITAIMGTSILLFNSCSNKKADVNPLLTKFETPFEVPPFEQIKPEHYMPAFEQGIVEARKEIEAIVKNSEEPTFENTIVPYDKDGELLTRVSLVFFAQASANTNDSIQAIEVEVSPKLSAFSDEVRLNPDLFKRIKSVYENQAKFNLTDEQSFLLENLYKGFVRNGANLDPVQQDTLKKMNQELSVLTVQFSQNVLSETNDYKLVIDKKEDLAGLPETEIASAASAAKAAGMDGKWIFTTQKPSMLPFLTYDQSRDLRRELYNAYTTRGNHGNEFDNNKILADIVRIRAARAKLLGYATHADITLEPRMAKTPQNVFDLLNSLWEKALPVAINERKEMQAIIDKEGGNFKLEPSDWWFYAEKLRKQNMTLMMKN